MRVAAGLMLAAALLTVLAVPARPEPGPPGTQAPDPRPDEAFAGSAVAGLQRTATDVQHELAGLADQIHEAERDLRTATDAAAAAGAERAAADQVVATQQAEVDAYSSTVYETLAQPVALRALLSADDPSEFLDGAGLLAQLRADQDERLAGALHRQDAAIRAQDAAEATATAAGDRKADLDRRNADAGNRAAAVSSELQGVVADTNAAVVAQQQAQRQRDQDTAANWRAYLDRLAAAGITPPPAQTLRDLRHFPPGLTPLDTPGLAERTLPSGERLLVLPAETVAAVTHAVDALGKPYVPGEDGTGPVAYSCDGLVRAAYGAAVPPGVLDQYGMLAPVTTPRPGDLAFLGPARYGVQGVGIVLDDRTMLAADARLAGVVVTDLPADALGFARPSLAWVAPRAAPAATDGGLPWRCGGVSVPAGVWGGYPNGFIPRAALCPVGAHLLRCDAAAAFTALSEAYAGMFGSPVCVTDSYRTFEAQVRLYGQKPALAAVPGTSNHGWGLAVDLCGGAASFGSPVYAWLAANAPAFGWVNPGWARPGGGREEPWHWEFAG